MASPAGYRADTSWLGGQIGSESYIYWGYGGDGIYVTTTTVPWEGKRHDLTDVRQDIYQTWVYDSTPVWGTRPKFETIDTVTPVTVTSR